MQVHTPTRSLLIQAPHPAVIMSAVPAREVPGTGFNLQIRHTEATTLKLREMGIDAPSPIEAYYKWPLFKGRHKPFAHQREMAQFMTLHHRCFNLGEMGVGKTSATLWAMDYLMGRRKVRKVLVVAPLSTLERVWLIGAAETIMHRTCAVVHGSTDKRLQLLKSDVDIFIINHEGLAIRRVREAIMARGDIDLVVVDEGSKYRNSKTDRYRALEAVVSDPRKRLWWLTGTPCPTGPEDAWAQVRLVAPGRVPRFFGSWRMQTMIKVAEHIWKPKANASLLVHNAMQPAILFRKQDCLDLPPMTTQDVTVKMSDDQMSAFRQMQGAMQVVHRAEKAAGISVTAANAGDRVNKLRQILLGSLKTGPNDYYVYDYKARFNALLEGIEEASAKVIVVVPFKGILQDLERRLRKHTTCALVNGDVSIGRRNKIFDAFKTTKDPHVLLCHPEVMSHGLNLTEADYLIFFGPIYSNDNYRQVIERFNRPPQTKKMTLLRIGAHPIEWAIYSALERAESQQQAILKLYHQIVGDEA